jgi:hypothetical protein
MLMRLTGFRLAWLLISIAFFIMAVRRFLNIPGLCSWSFAMRRIANRKAVLGGSFS